jgi:hypothetical protein
MNDSSFVELKDIVERAVQLVRASPRRKRRIREELLAHVSDVFEDELSHHGDERIAMAETRQRFGAAEALEHDLQASVPFFERWLSTPEKENIMSRWLWGIAILAVPIGPAIILPALALLKNEHVFQPFPILLGALITACGIALIGYGVGRHFARPA